jgi:hypothetical protein
LAMFGRIGSGKPINRGPAVKGAYTYRRGPLSAT